MEPVAYGLKFAGSFCGGAFLSADLTAKIQAAGVDASAYAVKLDGGQTSVIILNKDAEKDLELILDFGTGNAEEVETETLHAPALDSRKAEITKIGQARPFEERQVDRQCSTCDRPSPHPKGLKSLSETNAPRHQENGSAARSVYTCLVLTRV
jgi:hypothetical protein